LTARLGRLLQERAERDRQTVKAGNSLTSSLPEDKLSRWSRSQLAPDSLLLVKIGDEKHTMPRFYMISNRVSTDEGLGSDEGELSYFTSDSDDLVNFGNWSSVSPDRFKKLLIGAANAFPLITDPAQQEEQKHITIFIHGYDNTWAAATNHYKSLYDALYADAAGLGLIILFNWPSLGSPAAYLSDREHARGTAADFAFVLSALYDWLLIKQQDAVTDDKKACRAKISIIAHSMGNYVLQEAMNIAWERKNKPLLVSLVNQLLMVAADVDNDLFKTGENIGDGDGEGIANLTYRVSALYSPRDPVLGVSAGLKHFGKRRLGRSGLDEKYTAPDNVWEMDCTDLFPAGTPSADVHSVYFASPEVLKKMRSILQGIDRTLIT
jgi:esterase/lipase superfamily enzyme